MAALFLFISLVFAQNCPLQKEELGPYRFRQEIISPRLGCVVAVNSRSDSTPRRSFHFYKNGQLIVTSQIGSVLNKNTTGYRTYFILPAGSNSSIQSIGSGMGVKIKDTAGLNWNFNERGQVKSQDGCELAANDDVSWAAESTENNKPGGFYIKKCPGSIIIDAGFRRNGDPTLNQDKVITIRDSKGKFCSVRNGDIFSYPNKSESILKYKNSKNFYNFLSRNSACRDLDLNPLSSNSRGSRPSTGNP